MPFFAPLAVRPAFDESGMGEPWYEEGDRVFGGVVPVRLILEEGERVAVVVSHIEADPAGLSFRLSIVHRIPNVEDEQWHGHPGGDLQEEGLRFGVGLSDGTVVEVRPFWASDGSEAVWTLQTRGGSGSNARFDQELRLEPAPPPGPVTFACAWPELDVAEVTAVVAGDAIAAAREVARTLWPDDPDGIPADEGWQNSAPDGRDDPSAAAESGVGHLSTSRIPRVD